MALGRAALVLGKITLGGITTLVATLVVVMDGKLLHLHHLSLPWLRLSKS